MHLKTRPKLQELPLVFTTIGCESSKFSRTVMRFCGSCSNATIG